MSSTNHTFNFHPELNIAGVAADSDWHDLRVLTLLQNPATKQPSVNAFLGARYSRSADSAVDIAKEVYGSDKDAAKRLEAIFHGYGHKSVGDMADLFLCLENIPMLLAERFFYSNPTHAGQARSTRYQNFSQPKFARFPKDEIVPAALEAEFNAILAQQLQDYNELLEPTKQALLELYEVDPENKQEMGALAARAFDTARYFLPTGLQTSLGVVMSARAWSERIGYYRASTLRQERELGDLIYNLLVPADAARETGYLPEADGLIRYTEANNTRNNSVRTVLGLLEEKAAQLQTKLMNLPQASTKLDSLAQMFAHYLLLLSPNAKISSRELSSLITHHADELGSIVFSEHNHHNQIGSTAQQGSILLEGWADYGTLKDLLRHRSLEKFIPLLEDLVDLRAELDREPTDCFVLCPYLERRELRSLRNEYQKRMKANYLRIKDWVQKAYQELSPDLAREYGRYLLPHGHLTRYRFYGSVDDLQYLISLRTRNGGHIAYRLETYRWLQQLAQDNPFWKVLLRKLPAVDASSRDQFVDRS